MELGQKNEIIMNKISYFSFLKLDNDKLIKDKEKDTIINDEIYLNIDSKNHFVETSDTTIELVNTKIDDLGQNNDLDEQSLYSMGSLKSDDVNFQKENLTRKIMKKFLDKLYPDCESKSYKISFLISRNMKKIPKTKVEEYINYFFDKRFDLKYSTTLKFSLDFFINCGYIFCYIYSKLNDILVMKLRKNIEIVINNNINVLTDFYDYCTEKEKDLSETKKTYAWENNGKKYDIPPEMIFLINIFQSIDTLEFDINFICDYINKEDFNLFTITILNISYILSNLKNININFSYNNLQYVLYDKYYAKLLNIIKLGKDNIQKNKIKYNFNIYNKKWDFEHNFNLEDYRKKLIEKEKMEYLLDKIIYDKYSILYMVDSSKDGKNNICNSMILKNNKYKINHSVTFFNDFEVISNDDEEEEEDFYQKIKLSRTGTFYNSAQKLMNNKTMKDSKINSKNNINKENNNLELQISLIYNIILMTICGVTRLSKVKKLNLTSNDFYNRNIIIYLLKNFNINALSIDNQFHILDLFCNKMRKLETLNIEINSLDILSAEKIFGLIYKNQGLLSLKISFFSSDVSYFITTLLKTYEEFMSYNDIKEFAENQGKYITLQIFQEKMLDDILEYFNENLNFLFEIIKTKSDLEDLGLNFDLPNILINNMNYKIPIIKFILNILFLIDNNENKRKSKIKKLTLLSPQTIFDTRSENNIDSLFQDIRINKNSNQLEELNIQAQFYNIKYVKNIISTKLIILSIGDLDISTFEELVNYLTSYKFSSESSLTNLNIKLLNKIIYFDTQIKLLMMQLFGLKIKGLLELKLYTNLIINNKVNYLYLVKILNYNWIPSYYITLNEKCQDIAYSNNRFQRDIYFIVSPNIESKISEEYELNLKKKDKNDQRNDLNDEIYWILKYIFYIRYPNYSLNFIEIKNISFSILKYLYLTSNIKLSHNIIEEETN